MNAAMVPDREVPPFGGAGGGWLANGGTVGLKHAATRRVPPDERRRKQSCG